MKIQFSIKLPMMVFLACQLCKWVDLSVVTCQGLMFCLTFWIFPEDGIPSCKWPWIEAALGPDPQQEVPGSQFWLLPWFGVSWLVSAARNIYWHAAIFISAPSPNARTQFRPSWWLFKGTAEQICGAKCWNSAVFSASTGELSGLNTERASISTTKLWQNDFSDGLGGNRTVFRLNLCWGYN